MKGARFYGLFVFVSVLALRAASTAFTVTTTADSGGGSLRQAIIDANANPGLDQITFNIPGAGVHTITPLTPLPDTTGDIEILGFTQPGASPNTNGPGLPDNSVHLIEIDGTNSGAGVGAGALRTGGNFIIEGLVINRAPGAAIQVNGATGTISGNFVGVDPTGLVALPNSYGIMIENAKGVQIGGLLPEQRNVIAGNKSVHIGFGCFLGGGLAHVVQGNFIGVAASGTSRASGAPTLNETGIGLCFTVTDVTIGGPTAAARNVISGNTFIGINVSNSFAGLPLTAIVIQAHF